MNLAAKPFFKNTNNYSIKNSNYGDYTA